MWVRTWKTLVLLDAKSKSVFFWLGLNEKLIRNSRLESFKFVRIDIISNFVKLGFAFVIGQYLNYP